MENFCQELGQLEGVDENTALDIVGVSSLQSHN
jgi:hypothetical protein